MNKDTLKKEEYIYPVSLVFNNTYIKKNGSCTTHKGCKAVCHLSWCIEGERYKEYLKLPWYKKVFINNPLNEK